MDSRGRPAPLHKSVDVSLTLATYGNEGSIPVDLFSFFDEDLKIYMCKCETFKSKICVRVPTQRTGLRPGLNHL